MLNRFLSTPQQQEYIRRCFDKGFRIDGRKNNECRSRVTKNEVLKHLPGSAYSFVNHEDVEIYVGIKAKVEKKQLNDLQSMHQAYEDLVKLEISCMQKLDDNEQEQLNFIEQNLQNTYLNRIAEQLYQSKELLIENCTEHAVAIYVDVFLLANPHSSQIELIQQTLHIALSNVQIANLHAITNQITKEEKVQIDPNHTTRRLKVKTNIGVYVVGVVNQEIKTKLGHKQQICQLVLDLSREQYEALDKVIELIVDKEQGKVIEIVTLKGKLNPNQIVKGVNFILSYLKQ